MTRIFLGYSYFDQYKSKYTLYKIADTQECREKIYLTLVQSATTIIRELINSEKKCATSNIKFIFSDNNDSNIYFIPDSYLSNTSQLRLIQSFGTIVPSDREKERTPSHDHNN